MADRDWVICGEMLHKRYKAGNLQRVLYLEGWVFATNDWGGCFFLFFYGGVTGCLVRSAGRFHVFASSNACLGGFFSFSVSLVRAGVLTAGLYMGAG